MNYMSAVVFVLPGSESAVRLAMEKLILPELGHAVRERHPAGKVRPSQLGEIDGQQNRDEAVAEVAECARRIKAGCGIRAPRPCAGSRRNTFRCRHGA